MKQDKKNMEEEANISPVERAVIDDSFSTGGSTDELQLKKAQLDNVDDDGEPLNEQSLADDVSGEDLDIPGAEADDENEMIGEEDEENNAYSQADTE